MSSIVMNPTSTAQWHALVAEAEAACELHLAEELESYLVFLLMRFAGRPEMASAVLALEYLSGVEAGGRVGAGQLRDVGDQCLLFSGLFPKRAERRRVRISYYVSLGRSAYQQLAQSMEQNSIADFYGHLSHAFVTMMDVLQAMRTLAPEKKAALEPLDAYDLWQDTGSANAFRTLLHSTDGTPVPGDDDKRH